VGVVSDEVDVDLLADSPATTATATQKSRSRRSGDIAAKRQAGRYTALEPLDGVEGLWYTSRPLRGWTRAVCMRSDGAALHFVSN